jgi:hypothetical protein
VWEVGRAFYAHTYSDKQNCRFPAEDIFICHSLLSGWRVIMWANISNDQLLQVVCRSVYNIENAAVNSAESGIPD